MDTKYRILQVLYDIVKDQPHPLQYHCNTREIILRLKGNWQSEYLEELARENLIQIKKSSTVVLLLTEKGLEKAKQVFANRDHDQVS
jgi:Mn-dependent DtxR family transcriptional regulator